MTLYGKICKFYYFRFHMQFRFGFYYRVRVRVLYCRFRLFRFVGSFVYSCVLVNDLHTFPLMNIFVCVNEINSTGCAGIRHVPVWVISFAVHRTATNGWLLRPGGFSYTNTSKCGAAWRPVSLRPSWLSNRYAALNICASCRIRGSDNRFF